METRFRHDIMKMAHEIERATHVGKSDSLMKAWKLYKFEKSLQKGVVRFAFRKKDGTIRLAKGTLKGTEELLKTNKRQTYKTICYYDVNAQAFRSFKIENLIAIY